MSKISTGRKESNWGLPSSFSSSSVSSPPESTSITSGLVSTLSSSPLGVGSLHSLLTTGEETFESACLTRLRGRAIELAPFLIRLMPRPTALVLDLTAVDTEDVETTDWGDEREDLAEDCDFKDWGIRKVKLEKAKGIDTLLNGEARSR
jgi:hypothetical protein